jgi:RHS repeat-associated protein
MRASSCLSGPSGSVLKESTASGLSAKEVTYKYSAPDISATVTSWTCYNFLGDNGSSGLPQPCAGDGVTYAPDEATAVAYQTVSDGCSLDPFSQSQTVGPAGDWNPNLGVDPIDQMTQFDTRPYNLYSQNPYNSSCATVVSAYRNLIRVRKAFCPVAYGLYAQYVPPLTLSSVQTCHNSYTGYVIGPILECPAGNSASTQVGDPCDVATGDFSETEPDYSGGDLFLARYYHSANLESHHGLGVGWTHNYAAYLVLTSGVPTGLLRPDGHHDAVQNINGEYVSLSGAAIHIQQSGTNWTASLGDGSGETYDSTGRLIQLVSVSGLLTSVNYDGSGQLASVVGPFGHTLRFSYNASGQIAHVTDPGGQIIAYTYDSTGNLTSVTYQDGSQRNYLYENNNLPHNLTGIVDESAHRFLTATYDSSTGAVLSSQQAGGAQAVSISYGDALAVVTDSLNGVTTYSFTADSDYSPRAISVSLNGLMTSLTVPTGDTDPQRRATQRTDPNGNVTTYSYDADHLISKTEAYGTPQARTTSYRYLAANSALPTSITESLRATAFTYYPGTANVHTKTVTDTATNVSRTWTYTYDSYGRVLTLDGPRTDISDVTAYTYFNCTSGAECGHISTATDAAGHVTTYATYNAYGQPLTIGDANGVVTTFTYDVRQRVTSRRTANETTSFAYYPTGLLKTVTLPDSSTLTYTYDGAHRLTQITDSLGNQTSYTLDAMANHIAETTHGTNGVLHRTHSRVFNALNQLYQEVNAAGTAAVTTTYGYDNDGNQTSVAAPLAHNTGQTYDPLNRLSRITDPASGVTQFGYDANDNLTSVVDPRSLTTSYSYSGLGDLVSLSSPDSGSTTNTYDTAGNLGTSTDARGAVATYNYDGLNRPTSVAYRIGGTNDQTIAFTYDSGANGIGHLTGASDANHSLTWTYDALGRITGKSQTVGNVRSTVVYAYTDGDLTSLTTPAGRTITYGYNGNHQVISVAINGMMIATGVTYEPFGPVNGWTWGNSTATVRTFDTDGNISSITSSMSRSYDYDTAQRIRRIADNVTPTLSWIYDYDSLDRLSSAVSSSQSEAFTYDANGTRLSQSGTISTIYGVANSTNQLSNISGATSRTYSYDAAGHTTGYSGFTFTYNASGRLNSVTSRSGTASYIYNALGQRVKKTTSSGATLFVYDESGHLLGEYDGSGNALQEIVWMGDIPIASIRLETSGLSIFYIHTDHLNTPRRITRRSTSDVVWSWDSDPFGTSAPNENPSGLGTFSFNSRFPGQYYDVETALNYNSARDYDASTGRYIESDPIGLDGGSYSTYAYANGNPASVTDPLGLAPPGRTAPSPASPGIWPSSGPFDQSWSQAVQNTAQQITDAVDNAIEAVKAACKTCPECSPYKKGTIGYVGPHTDHDHKPIGRPHLNLSIVNQNPQTCKCFWNKRGKPNDVAAPPPLPDWVDLNAGEPPLSP